MSEKTRTLTNDLLKELMTDAVVKRGYVTDFNNLRQSGIYLINGKTVANKPPAYSDYSVVIVFAWEASYLLQIVATASKGLFYRMYWWNEWSDWRKITTEAME